MDDLLLAVDLESRPVSVHADDPASAEAPEQTGAVEVIEGACWMTSEQGLRVPAEVGGTLGPGLALVEKPCAVIEEKLPA
jgi:hypothetical protein